MSFEPAFTLVPCIPVRSPVRLPSRRPSRSRLYRRDTPAARLPSSVASIKDERTGARIFVVGCVHGSKVSADDVKNLLDETSPDAVVLELCDSRLKSVKKAMETKLDGSKKTPRRRTFKQISSTFGGTGPALVAFALESVYKLQTLAGVQPGSEFYEPIRRASSWTLVCGDAPAHDTVRELYHVFGRPLRSLRQSLASIQDIIGRLIIPPKGGVNTFRIFFTEPRRMRELVRLTFPALLISGVVGLAGNAGALALESAPAISMLNDAYTAPLVSVLLSLGQALFVSYIIVSTLHFLKVLIADRDRVLTRSILDTASQLQSERKTSVVVCAVVGLLHVNGIVREIQEQGDTVQS